LGKQFG